MVPTFVLLLEAFHQIGHLVFVPGGLRAGHAAPDIGAFGGAGTQRDMDVEIVGVVMNAVGVADGITGMKTLSESPHDFLHRCVQNTVGIDAGIDEFIVKGFRHAEDQPVLNDWIFRRSGKLVEVMKPRRRNSAFALRIDELGWRGTRPVRVDENQLMKKSPSVNLAESFFRGVVRKVFEFFTDAGGFQLLTVLMAGGMFPVGILIEVFKVQA